MGGTRSALLNRLALAASVGQTLVLRPLSLQRYLYNEGVVRLWPYACANGEHTVDVLRRLRTEWPDDKLIVVWNGASYHRACVVREATKASKSISCRCPATAPTSCRSRLSGAGSARMSPIITAIPPPRISAGGWPLSKHASIRTPAPSLTDSGSKITSTRRRKTALHKVDAV
jgi:hypothetical protein